MVFFASRKLGNMIFGNMIFRLPLQSLQLVAHRRPADICQPIKPYRTT